ncbi:hypothetical protein NliqN6_5014 [Naganishia liquefaciens]|uniref:Mediator of RNA polymerase II transcription subunit 17 n=1 Tax=Naganishia liquefaciens TaxID=104408 RepID=A0A8H3TWV1_9TREE|nr:hypothetical protein NliqN6_5014 [Naganishia liquefaciens]
MVLSLEPFPQRVSRRPPVTAIDRKETAVLAFDKDSAVGDVIWDVARPPADGYNQAIRDVLVRKPARFFDVTLQAVEREDAEKDAKQDEDDGSQLKDPDDEDKADSATLSDNVINVNGKMMTIQEMGQMKVELHQTLGVAWNELNKIAELCRSLISSQPHPYVLPPNEATASIPAKSLTGTVADRSPPNQAVRLLADTKLAVVRHIDAVKRANEVLSNGSKQLRALNAQEETYWSNVLRIGGFGGRTEAMTEVKENVADAQPTSSTLGDALSSWSLLPRPLSNGVPPPRQMATDVMVPYAPDEAAPPFRALAMVMMAQRDSESEQAKELVESPIIYRARRNKRLRICVKSNTGCQTYSRVSGLADPGMQEPTERDIGKAQAEMFDDEVFEMIRAEAQNSPTLNTRSSADQISIDAVPGEELVFEMVDTDDTFEEQKNGSVTISTQAILLAALLRLGMIKIYRARKAAAIEGKPSQDRLLAPVIAYMHYQAFCRQLFQILRGFQIAMQTAGFQLEILKSTGGPSGGLDWDGLIGDRPLKENEGRSSLKGNVELLVNKRTFCTILLSTDAHLTIVFTHSTFNSQDIAQLPLFLSRELRREIISVFVDSLKSFSPSVQFHANEVAGIIKTKRTKLEIAFTLEGAPRIWAQASIINEPKENASSEHLTANDRITIEHYTGATSLIEWTKHKL